MSSWYTLRELAGGGNNEGIAVVMEYGTGMMAIRKSLNPTMSQKSVGDEVAMMEKLVNHPNIVQIYDSILASEDNSVHQDKIYMEYCKTIVDGREINTIHELSRIYLSKRETVPELFLWHLAEDMLRAIVFMQFGVRDVANEPNPKWEAIFHNDLYPVNVFLSAKTGSGTSTKAINMKQEYPRIVVGDFGQANTESGIQAYLAKHLSSKGYSLRRSDNKDINSVYDILQLFTVIRSPWVTVPESPLVTVPKNPWSFSAELREMMLSLKKVKDGSQSILTILRELIKTKERLIDEEKLVFKPLL